MFVGDTLPFLNSHIALACLFVLNVSVTQVLHLMFSLKKLTKWLSQIIILLQF